MKQKNSSESMLKKLLRLPGKLFNTRVRLAFAMSVGVLTLVLMAQFCELMPDPNVPKMEARKLQTETLAITGSSIAEAKGGSLRDFRATLENTVDRAEDLLTVGLRNKRGELVFEVGEHANTWKMPKDGRSNDQNMFVPISRAGKQVAQLELCYEPLVSFSGFIKSSTARLAIVLFLFSFVMFNFILYRYLKQLDPRGAVPRRVREAFNTMAEGLLILDRKGAVMLANDKFCSLVGIDADKMMGNSITKFPFESDHDELPWIAAIKSNKAVNDGSVKIADVNNLMRTFSVSAAPVLAAAGRCRGVIVTFDDITLLEEQRYELVKARRAADDANEAKSNFLSRMSHEIRTPMNAIIGFTDILQQGDTSQSDQVRYLTTIQSSGEHLLTLINDILDLSKIEAGQMTLEQRHVRLVPIMSQVVETLNMKASENKLYLDLNIEGEIPREITTDETRLRQVLLNMVGNAIKFTNEGGVTMIARYVKSNGIGMIEFDVIDTGIGISQSALIGIFDPFSQADDTVTRKFGGTGLGLAICKQLSKAMGGGIRVASEEGVGTTFTIAIDPGDVNKCSKWINESDLESEFTKPIEEKKMNYRFESGHVLVVDDGKANRDLAGIMLKRIGVTHETAVDGKDALEKIAKGSYDVVFMDIHMPVMDGLTATKHIRKAGLKLPVVALTAMVVEEQKRKCLANGCNAFLSKPIRIEPLVEVLSEFLPLSDTSRPTETNVETNSVETPAVETQMVHVEEKIEDDIETSLAKTMASMGFDFDEQESPVQSSQVDLDLPEVITSSLGDDADFKPIIEDFVNRLNGRIGEFQAAFDSNNDAELSDLAHWLAGSTATVGYEQFVDAARELEHCDGTDRTRMQELVNYLVELTRRIDMNLQPG